MRPSNSRSSCSTSSNGPSAGGRRWTGTIPANQRRVVLGVGLLGPPEHFGAQVQDVADPFDGDVRGRVGGEHGRVKRIVSLAREDRGDSLPPHVLDRTQNPQLVI